GLHGWQWMLLLEGLPTVLFGLCIRFYLPNCPADARWRKAEEKQALLEAARAGQAADHSVRGALKSAFSSGAMLLLAVIYFVTQLCVYGITFFMPSIIEAAGVQGSFQIGAMAGLPALGALIGVYVYPRLYRVYGRPILFAAVAMAGAAAATYVASASG